MTEREKLMYKILINISQADAPIVFKGALITKLILEESGFTSIDRATKDIDANWTGTPPTMSVLADTINRSLGDLRELYTAVPTRDYGEKRSAGVSIRDKATDGEVLSMDIDIKPVFGSRTYYQGEAAIKGVFANEILADKISACSGDEVYKWRTKDVLDVYALSHCVEVNVKEVFDVSETVKRKIQSFDAFCNKKSELEHSYNKLKGATGKPDFEELYSYLNKFFKPFINQDKREIVWDSEKVMWHQLEHEQPTRKGMRR